MTMEIPLSLFEMTNDDRESGDEQSLRGAGYRRKREFIPEDRKDATYWEKRRKNNEAAKRSREKRRANDYLLERRLLALSKENSRLQDELAYMKLRFGFAGPLGLNTNAAAASAALSAQHRGLLQLHAPCGLQPVPPPPLPPSHLPQPPPPPLLQPPPILLADKELVWGRTEGLSVPQAIPASYHHRPSSLSSYPAPSAFTSPRVQPFSRTFPFLLEMPGILSSSASPASLLLPPLLAPSAGSPWGGRPVPVRPGALQAASDEEAEQQVPGAATGLDSCAALPHKLRLKTHKGQIDMGSATTGTLSPPLYVSD